ncbi:MAG: hypothetical protein A2224_00535 [Candidatus Magasanikbacteria bacterium RIFOXYA2_FULL_40_20]|nr:MAG: hypothetical protein A2224_00535 [Candidatus Magasanikbacteria bacterium RIFOXYA2_FULL_40_20]
MEKWEIISLETDYSGETVAEFLEKEAGLPIKRRMQHKRKEYIVKLKQRIIRIISEAVGASKNRKMVVMGSGSFHHYTYGLCKHADKISQNYGYIHFDQHDDYQYEEELGYRDKQRLGCGSFVKDILEDTNASAALFIGSVPPKPILVPGKRHLHIKDKEIASGNWFEKLQKKLAWLPFEVYLSFDLDVMEGKAITTAWSPGFMTTKDLLRAIAIIKKSKKIIGADIIGYGGADNIVPGRELYQKIIKALS